MNSEDLINLVEEIIDEKLKKKYIDYKFFDKYFWVGEVDVVNAGNNTATILLPNQTIATSSKPNKTNQTLVSGDEVLLFSPYGTLGSAWIDKVFKQYV